jgi:two-component system alkaline phosphatase synthesis response regulator PhoP
MDAAVDRSTPIRLTLGRLEILPDAYRATFGGRDLPLSPSQLEVLAYLVRNRDRVVSRGELADAAGLVEGRSVDVALSTLRRMLGGRAVRNVRNRGWILEPGALEA